MECLHGAELYQSVVEVKVTDAQEQTLGVLGEPGGQLTDVDLVPVCL